MQTLVKRPVCCGLALVALLGSVSLGCVGVEDWASTPAGTTDSVEVSVATDLIPDATDDATGLTVSASSADSLGDSSSESQTALTDAELQLLQSVLSGLTGGTVGSSTSDALSGALSLANLKDLGFSRRDMAVWVLDLVAQQNDLSTEQAFAIELARALLSRDYSALESLLIQQLLPTLINSASAQAVAE